MTRKIGKAGLDLICGSEGLRLFAYPDPDSPLAKATPQLRRRWGYENGAKLLESLPAETRALSGAPWTIGWGHTTDVNPSDEINEHQAEVMRGSDLTWVEDCINLRATNVGQNQFDALASLVFNIGCPEFNRSTLLRLVRAGDYRAVAGDPAKNFSNGQFIRWNHDNGKVVDGLTARRIREAKLFLMPDAPAPADFSNVASGVDSTAPKVSP